MKHKIIIRNAVQRKPGFMYHINNNGEIIESPGCGPRQFNNKKNSGLQQQHFSTLRNETPTREKKTKSGPAQNSTLRNPMETKKKRLSNVQIQILKLIRTTKATIKQKEIVAALKNEYHVSSIYRSFKNLEEKGLIKRKRNGWFGPVVLEDRK